MKALIVDDNPTNVSLMQKLITRIDGCEAICFTDPVAAASALAELDFDLALVDYVMPDMDGVQFIQAVRALPRHAHVPIVMITTAEERAVRIEAIEAGANDFLSKPVDPVELKARVRNLLALRQAQRALADRAGVLQAEVNRAMRDLARREEEIVWRLSRATEGRDADTGSHIQRMSTICRLIAETLELPEETCHLIQVAAQMHDVGKVGIPDHILFKPGPLTPEERRVMQLHTTIGEEVLAGSESSLIQLAAKIAATHHEHWNGQGYPRGLIGEEIPLVGRIAAVADVFDALVSQRPYKKPWSIEDARGFIEQQRGKHFDPLCVDAFLKRFDEVVAIGRQAQAENYVQPRAEQLLRASTESPAAA